MKKSQFSVRYLCICAVCTALCVVLPSAFHALGRSAGMVLLPIHIPVLLCGLLCGWQYGVICGILGPILSFLLTSMPPVPALIPMVPELCIYGLTAGLVLKLVHTGHLYGDLYIALVAAMAAGRLVGGSVKALILYTGGEAIVLKALVSSYFISGIPGIALQLVALPTLVVILMKARLIPRRYPKA